MAAREASIDQISVFWGTAPPLALYRPAVQHQVRPTSHFLHPSQMDCSKEKKLELVVGFSNRNLLYHLHFCVAC